MGRQMQVELGRLGLVVPSYAEYYSLKDLFLVRNSWIVYAGPFARTPHGQVIGPILVMAWRDFSGVLGTAPSGSFD